VKILFHFNLIHRYILKEKRHRQRAIREHSRNRIESKRNDKVRLTKVINRSRRIDPSSLTLRITSFSISTKFCSKNNDDLYTLPKEKTSVAFEDSELTISEEVIFALYLHSHCNPTFAKIKEKYIKLE